MQDHLKLIHRYGAFERQHALILLQSVYNDTADQRLRVRARMTKIRYRAVPTNRTDAATVEPAEANGPVFSAVLFRTAVRYARGRAPIPHVQSLGH